MLGQDAITLSESVAVELLNYRFLIRFRTFEFSISDSFWSAFFSLYDSLGIKCTIMCRSSLFCSYNPLPNLGPIRNGIDCHGLNAARPPKG